MLTTRPGCYYCFKDLAADPAQESAAALGCYACGCLYHASCWHVAQTCSGCGSDQTEHAVVAIPPMPPIVDKRQSISIQPTAVIYLLGARIYTPARLRVIALMGSLAAIAVLALGWGGFYAATTLMARPSLAATPALPSAPSAAALDVAPTIAPPTLTYACSYCYRQWGQPCPAAGCESASWPWTRSGKPRNHAPRRRSSDPY
jgi:hypothetical protein